MDPYRLSHHRKAEAQRRHLLDTIVNAGPFTGHLLAAEDRQREAQRWAAVQAATHVARERPPGAGRRWLGALLIRAGGRLQGATVPRGFEPAAVAGSTGVAG